MGIGQGKGENKVKDAVKNAVESPLLETQVAGAKAILLNIAGGQDMGYICGEVLKRLKRLPC